MIEIVLYYSETNDHSMILYHTIQNLPLNNCQIKFQKLDENNLTNIPKIILKINDRTETFEGNKCDLIINILVTSKNIEYDLVNWKTFHENYYDISDNSQVVVKTKKLICKGRLPENPSIIKLTLEENSEFINNLINLQELICLKPIDPTLINLANLRLLECQLLPNTEFYNFSGLPSLEILYLNNSKKVVYELEVLDLSCLTKLRIFEVAPQYHIKNIKFSESILEKIFINDTTNTNALVTYLKIMSNEGDCDFSDYSICESFKIIKENRISLRVVLPINVNNAVLKSPKLSFIAVSQSLQELTIETEILKFSAFDVSFPSLKILKLKVTDSEKMTIILPKKIVELFITCYSQNLKILLNTRIEKIIGEIPKNIFIKNTNLEELYHVELNVKEDVEAIMSMFIDSAILKINDDS